MSKAFISISHFLDLHREQQKIAKSATFFVTNILFISAFSFTFKRRFCEKSLLKTTFCHTCASFVYRKAI